MTKLKLHYLALSAETRRIFWLMLALAAGLLAISVRTIPALVGENGWAAILSNVIPPVLGLVVLVSAWLVFTNRPLSGSFLFILLVSIGLLLEVISLQGAGVMLTTLQFITCTYIAGLAFSRTTFSWMPVVNISIGAAILLVDSYAKWERAWLSQNDLWLFGALLSVVIGIYLLSMLQNFPRFSLEIKLEFIFLIMATLPMALIGIMSTMFSRQSLESTANDVLNFSAEQVAARLDSFVNNNLDIVRTEAAILDFITYLEMPAHGRANSDVEMHVSEILNSLRQRDPIYITSYALLDLNGSDIIDTNTLELGSDFSGRDFFIEPVKTGLPYVSQVSFSPADGEAMFYFSAPVRALYGDIVGVLRVGYSAKALQQQLVIQGGLGSQQSYAVLIDDSQMIVAHSLQPELIHKAIVPLDDTRLAELRDQMRVPEGVVSQDLFLNLPVLASGLANLDKQANFPGNFQVGKVWTGNPSEAHEQAGAVRMTSLPWYVVEIQSRELLLQPSVVLAHATILMGIIAAVVGVFFALIVARYVSNPINRLAEATHRIEQGDLEARADIVREDEIGALAQAFNHMAAELSGMVSTLEQRVDERTRALATTAEVSRQLSTILDEKQLVRTVIDQLQLAFHYYHAHIYLWDSRQERLIMVGGSGEPGEIMLARGHSIPRGKGLVGRAADSATPVLVEDVTLAPNWLPNPLLPNTRSELAVPIVSGETVLGVLDVQQDMIGALTRTDIDLLQSISNQVAIALLNARAYAQAQRKANREAMISAISQSIQQTTSAEDALRVTARELGRALGVETVVRLGLPEKDRQNEDR